MKKLKNDPQVFEQFKLLLKETVYPKEAEAAFSMFMLSDCLKDLRIYCKSLEKYKVFYDHIQSHLWGDRQVICKICNKTYQEIINEWLLGKGEK